MTDFSTPNPHVHNSGNELRQVHVTDEQVAVFELTPPHPPREETPAYKAAHHHLVVELDMPCLICGVRQSTLADPKQNPSGAKAMESHHYPVERSLLDAVDLAKIRMVWSEVTDLASLQNVVDSEKNLIVLCDIHHRSLQGGIHHLLVQDWVIQPYLKAGYQIASTAKDEAAAMQKDQQIEQALEQGMLPPIPPA